MDLILETRLRGEFAHHTALKLVYFFGSRAEGHAGPMSDFDFGLYFDGLTLAEMFECELEVATAIGRILNTDAVDIVNLTTCEMPELRYDIVTKGQRIYTVEPFHVIVEPRIWNEYFDFRDGLVRNGLTRATS